MVALDVALRMSMSLSSEFIWLPVGGSSSMLSVKSRSCAWTCDNISFTDLKLSGTDERLGDLCWDLRHGEKARMNVDD